MSQFAMSTESDGVARFSNSIFSGIIIIIQYLNFKKEAYLCLVLILSI
jgi:hypothetical protein